MTIHCKDPSLPAQGCVIWMHGLGADAQDMVGLAEALNISVPLRHVFLDAPVRPVTLNQGLSMRAWYDILGVSVADREDREGIIASEVIIRQVINQQVAAGFSPQTIFLAGFSQGGAMALFTGLQHNTALAGIIALSGYLPLATEINGQLDKQTPFFVGIGQYDAVVLPTWTQASLMHIKAAGYERITLHTYPIGHGVSAEEIEHLSLWIETVMSKIKDSQ